MKRQLSRENIENIVCLLLAFFSSTSLCINNDRYRPNEDQMSKLIGVCDGFFWRADSSFQQSTYLIFMIGVLLFFAFKQLLPKMKREELKWSVPFSFLFSLMILLCSSYHKHYSWEGVFGSFSAFVFSSIKGIGVGILFVFIFNLLGNIHIENRENSDVQNKRKRILKYTCILLALWIPYMIILFPGCTNADTRDQIAQIVDNYDYSWTAKSVVLKNSDIIWNNHHPVFYTAILSAFVKVGSIIGSYSWAFEMYSIGQCIFLATSLACQIVYIQNKCRSRRLVFFAFSFFACNPMFPIWGMTIMKDTFFSILIWWIIIIIYELINEKTINFKMLIMFGSILFIWFLIRNNGFYIFLSIIPIICVYLWKNKKKMIRVVIAILAAILLFQGVVQGYLFSIFNITSGSPREMLSVPFMQTARYVKEYRNEISDVEEDILLSIFNTSNNCLDDIVEKYDSSPDRSDNLKELYNKETDKETLIKYIKFWGKCLFKHPLTYIQAFLCLNYSWFTFESHHDNRYYNGICDTKIADLLPDMKNPSCFKEARNILNSIISIMSKIPFTSWLVEFSFYTWICLFAFIVMINRRKKAEIIALSPLFINYLICFVGPVAYMRYALPALVCLPTIILYSYHD